MAIQSALAQVGAAKQTAKGSAAAAPMFAHGVTGGAVMVVAVDQELEDHTSGKRQSPGVNRTAVTPGLDFQCRAHSKSVGLYLFGALGGKATSGTGPTYTHAFTLADDLPYLTIFGTLNGNIYSVQDCKIDSLGLSWEGNNPVEVSASGTGTIAGFPASFTPTTDDTYASYFTAAVGTFKMDVDSGTAVTAPISSGEISISNSVEAIMLSGSITPSDVSVGRQEVEVTLEIVVNDLTDWRTILTGTAAGTTASATTVYGSFEIVFTNGTDTLTLASTRVAFTTDFPEADPSGGPVKLSLAGLVPLTAAGAAGFTATLVNAQATY